MLEEVKIKGHPEIKKVIAITEIKKYKPEDCLVVVVDTDNIDDLNEATEQVAMLLGSVGYAGNILVRFQDTRFEEQVVKPEDDAKYQEEAPKE